ALAIGLATRALSVAPPEGRSLSCSASLFWRALALAGLGVGECFFGRLALRRGVVAHNRLCRLALRRCNLTSQHDLAESQQLAGMNRHWCAEWYVVEARAVAALQVRDEVAVMLPYDLGVSP